MVRPSNAYGSICSSQADESAMELYLIQYQEIFRRLSGIQIRFTLDDYTTSWQRAENWIVTGRTMSPILFVMGMVTRTAQKDPRPRMYSAINHQSKVHGGCHGDNNEQYTDKMGPISVTCQTTCSQDANSKREDPFNIRNSNLM